MVETLSTLGLQMISSANLTGGQYTLSRLSQQLTTGKYSSNLSDYSSSDAQQILNFNNKITEQNGFLSVINTISPRIELYDSSMTAIEDSASQIYSGLLTAANYNAQTVSSLQTTIKGAMDSMNYYLNQKLGDRYIYAGTRYDQAPVLSTNDILALPSPPTETAPYLSTSPSVPAYDTDAADALPHPEAYVKDSVMVDTTKDLSYGVTSNDTGFQQIMMGLRWAYAATNDPTNYNTYMSTAKDLISQGIINVRATHTDVTNAYNTINNTKDTITTNLSNLKDQVDNIENVDINDVSVKITVLKSQLEASYAVTAKMIDLSILKYL